MLTRLGHPTKEQGGTRPAARSSVDVGVRPRTGEEAIGPLVSFEEFWLRRSIRVPHLQLEDALNSTVGTRTERSLVMLGWAHRWPYTVSHANSN